jgi:ketohexokinase
MSSPDQELCRFPEDGPLPPVHVVDAIGAGDTFIAGVLYGLLRHPSDWPLAQRLEFASSLATLKVQREGFAGLGADMLHKET